MCINSELDLYGNNLCVMNNFNNLIDINCPIDFFLFNEIWGTLHWIITQIFEFLDASTM